MSSYAYGFVNARVGAMKSNLLSGLEIGSLIESRNFDDAVALLKSTAYAKELSKVSSPSVWQIENTLLKCVLQDYEKLLGSVNGMSRSFLLHYSKKFEIEAIKSLLIMKSKGEEIKEYPWILEKAISIPTAERLVEAKTTEELIEMLRFTSYYPALQKAVTECDEKGTVYPYIKALDTYQYGELRKIIKRKLGDRDKKIVGHLVGIEIDAKNLLIALRIRGSDEEDILSWMVPMRYRLSDSDLTAAFNVTSLSELQQILKNYTDIISTSAKVCEDTQSLFPLEQEFKRFILKENNRVFCGDRFHMGVPLAYLNLRENEVRNITAILHGKEEGLSTSKIEEIVILST